MSFNSQQVKSKKKLLPIVMIIFVVIVFLIFGELFRNIPEIDGKEFMINREISQINGLEKGFQLGGRCIKKYYLHLIGMNGGRRYFAVTFDLASNPKDDGQLASLLATSPCEEEIAKALVGIKKQFSSR